MPTTRRVMLIEDDDAHAEITSYAIASVYPDAEIMRFCDGEDALVHMRCAEMNADSLPHIIFIDVEMFGIDGFTVLEKMRDEDLSHDRIPKIILTTTECEMGRARAQSLNANGFLVKPMDFRSFQALMKAAIDKWTNWSAPRGNLRLLPNERPTTSPSLTPGQSHRTLGEPAIVSHHCESHGPQKEKQSAVEGKDAHHCRARAITAEAPTDSKQRRATE